MNMVDSISQATRIIFSTYDYSSFGMKKILCTKMYVNNPKDNGSSILISPKSININGKELKDLGLPVELSSLAENDSRYWNVAILLGILDQERLANAPLMRVPKVPILRIVDKDYQWFPGNNSNRIYYSGLKLVDGSSMTPVGAFNISKTIPDVNTNVVVNVPQGDTSFTHSQVIATLPKERDGNHYVTRLITINNVYIPVHNDLMQQSVPARNAAIASLYSPKFVYSSFGEASEYLITGYVLKTSSQMPIAVSSVVSVHLTIDIYGVVRAEIRHTYGGGNSHFMPHQISFNLKIEQNA